MTAMRILQISPVPPELGGRDTGGIATHLHGLATHLAAQGHEVAVLADNRVYDAAAWPARVEGLDVYGIADFSGPRRTAGIVSPGGVRDLAIARRALRGGWTLRWTAAKVAAYRAVLKTVQPDIVHVHTLENRFALADAVLRGSVPLVTTVHSSHYVEFAGAGRRAVHTRLVERDLSLARELIFVSRYLDHRYTELFPGVSTARTRVVPNPVDAPAYAPLPMAEARAALGVSSEGPLLVFVGNLIERKDPSSFVHAVAKLLRRDIDLHALVVGAGPEEDLVRHLAMAEGISGRIRFDGRKTQSELPAYYSAADVFVFPSLMESFGLVALEAMLCGTPVVGTPEVFEEVVPEECGLRANPGDPESLADAIEAALAKTWDRQAIREYALGFDWDERVHEFEDVYTEVVAGW